jgi:hypothetical protein
MQDKDIRFSWIMLSGSGMGVGCQEVSGQEVRCQEVRCQEVGGQLVRCRQVGLKAEGFFRALRGPTNFGYSDHASSHDRHLVGATDRTAEVDLRGHFRNPMRVFFNPSYDREVWVASFGNGLYAAPSLPAGKR